MTDTGNADWAAAQADAQAVASAIGDPHRFDGLINTLLAGHYYGASIFYEEQQAPEFARPCDVYGTSEWTFHLLRVGSDGSSVDTVVKTWDGNVTVTYTPSDSWPYYTSARVWDGPGEVSAMAHVITNADQGALYSWQWSLACNENIGEEQDDPTCISNLPVNRLTLTAGGGIASDVTWTNGGLYTPDEPILQTEDGYWVSRSFVPGNEWLVVFNAAGVQKWNKYGFIGVMATPGGGVIAQAADGSGYYEFDADGNAVGQISAVPAYSWFQNVYSAAAAGAASVSANILEWGAGFASMSSINPSETSTFVGVAAGLEGGPPMVALSSWGRDCSPPPGFGQKVPLGADGLLQYQTLKDALLNSGRLTIGPTSCSNLLNSTGRHYFDGAWSAVKNQRPYDGRLSTITMWDAGMLPPDFVASNPADNRIVVAKKTLACEFVLGTMKNSRRAPGYAAAQMTPPSGGGPATDVYINTDPNVLPFLSQGTILHEALHNLTQRTDFLNFNDRRGTPPPADLKTIVGIEPIPGVDPARQPNGTTSTIDISNKLRAVGCVSQ